MSEDGASHRRLELPLNNEHQTYPSDNEQNDIIIYRSKDGKVNVALMTREGKVWLNQMQIAKLFGTSKQSISHHIAGVLKDNELDKDTVVKYYLTTASDGRNYKVLCVVYDATFYSFLRGKHSFSIDCAGFWDKIIIFAV